MNWSDERYVRVYTRDTPDWQCLSFLAQGLFCLVLRKVDRAGVLPLGRSGRKAVAIAIGHAHQWPLLEPALDELLADGCLRIEGELLVVPNFIEAQEAEASDKARAKAYRERRRDLAKSGIASAEEPNRGASRGVTAEHEKPTLRDGTVTSRDGGITGRVTTVTPSRTVPNRTEQTEERALGDPRAEGAVARLAILGRDETYAQKYPSTAALLVALDALGTPGAWSRDAATRGAVELAIGAQDPGAVAQRVKAAIVATSKPWLGMHLDAVRGTGPGAAPAPRMVCVDFEPDGSPILAPAGTPYRGGPLR